MCTIGPDTPTPDCCLNCGATRTSDRCSECGVEHQVLVDRVREHCELPPRTDKILALRDRGLFRLAFNAVALRRLADPNDLEALTARAKLLTDVERPEQAVPLLRRVIALGGQAEAEIDLGVALANSGQTGEAILVYQSFALTYPTHPARGVVLSNLGGCLSTLGRTREGEDYHRQAIIADPEHLGPRWNLFANLCSQGRYTEALVVLERASELPSLEPHDRENIQAFRSHLLDLLERITKAGDTDRN
jgi:Tfp pilus assembly protein PilF